jgi:hypothetical protein
MVKRRAIAGPSRADRVPTGLAKSLVLPYEGERSETLGSNPRDRADLDAAPIAGVGIGAARAVYSIESEPSVRGRKALPQ